MYRRCKKCTRRSLRCGKCASYRNLLQSDWPMKKIVVPEKLMQLAILRNCELFHLQKTSPESHFTHISRKCVLWPGPTLKRQPMRARVATHRLTDVQKASRPLEVYKWVCSGPVRRNLEPCMCVRSNAECTSLTHCVWNLGALCTIGSQLKLSTMTENRSSIKRLKLWTTWCSHDHRTGFNDDYQNRFKQDGVFTMNDMWHGLNKD